MIKEGLRKKFFLLFLEFNYLLMRMTHFMIRIMGNSTERVQLKDLNDVVYYKQVKEFSDADLASSKDLNRELRSGRLVQLEKVEAPRGSDSVIESSTPHNGSTITINDLRAVLREFLPSMMGNNGSSDIKEAIKEIAPLITDMVKQELARLPAHVAPGSGVRNNAEKIEGAFQDLAYVPEVSTDGLVSKVEAKQTAVSGDSANDALAALRKLNKIPNKS